MTKISDERLQEMLEASQAVTPGPWLHSRSANRPVDGQSYEIGSPTRGVAGMMYGGDAAYVKLCDPGTMRSILTELQYLRQLDKEQESGHIQPIISQNAPQPAGVRVKGLERFSPCLRPNGRVNDPGMKPDVNGEWVRLSALETQEEEAVAVWIEREALDQLLRHKTATATVSSGLLSKPFGEKIPLYAHPTPVQKEEEGQAVTFQERVAKAHIALFHDDPTDLAERRDRFGEEANELQQALGQTREAAHQLVDYTYDRPVGQPEKEIGASALTLASLCVIGGWDMQACAEADLAALTTPEKITKVRAKRATRHGRGPLPGFDAALVKP